MAQTEPGAAEPDSEGRARTDSGLNFVITGVIRMWWVWFLSASGIVLYTVAADNEWNFVWFPALWAVLLGLWGAMKVNEYRRSELGRLQYMRDYGIQREAKRYHCNLCGATFRQPEGADLCPECYEDGIVVVEDESAGGATAT